MAMKEMISHCRIMYSHSLDGLQYLNPEWRKAVRIAALLYESILDKIEHNNYDVFTKNCRTSLKDKCIILYNYNRNNLWNEDIL
jgi:phytoene synthase